MKKFDKKILFILIVVALIEVFIFNGKFFLSLSNKPIKVNNYELHDIKKSNGGLYLVTGKNPYIEINANKKVDNLYIDLSGINYKSVSYYIDYTDSANKYYEKETSFNEYKYTSVHNIESTKYVDCNYIGKAKTIRIKVDIKEYKVFRINKIAINQKYNFNFNIYRYFIISLVACFIYLSNKLDLFKKTYGSKSQKYILWITVSLFLVLMLYLYSNLGKLNSVYDDIYSENYVTSIMNGKLYIGEDNVKGLNNVYDHSEALHKDVSLTFDSSYYNGKNYVYFGILPALIMAFIKLIAFKLNTYSMSMILIVISTIFSVKLLKEIIYKYYSKTSFLVFLLLTIFYLFNFRIILLLTSIRYYEMIVLFGYTLGVTGLYYIFKSSKDKINYKYLLIGNILLSLELLTRPNMILLSLLIIPIIYKYINKKDIKKILLTFIPYIVLLIVVMILNYIRFDNVFEFGQTYQLTILDHTKTKISITSMINGIVSYLFRFPVINSIFPYVNNNLSILYYNQFYYNTSCGNGIITMSILGLLLFSLPKYKNTKMFKFSICSVILGLLLICIDSNVGGTLNRYTLEFGFLFLIPTILVTLETLNKYDFKKLLLIIVLISCFMNIMVMFDNSSTDNGVDYNETIYQIEEMFKI